MYFCAVLEVEENHGRLPEKGVGPSKLAATLQRTVA